MWEWEMTHEYPHLVDLSPPVSFVVDVNLHDRGSEYSERESSRQHRFKIKPTSQERPRHDTGQLSGREERHEGKVRAPGPKSVADGEDHKEQDGEDERTGKRRK